MTEELSEEREKVRQAEKRVVELERDLNQSRLATEKANKDKDEAIREAKIEATRMSKKIESFEKEEQKSKVSVLDICVESKVSSK